MFSRYEINGRIMFRFPYRPKFWNDVMFFQNRMNAIIQLRGDTIKGYAGI